MKSIPPLVTLLAVAAAVMLACGSGSTSRPPTPGPAAQRNVIAFGARDGAGYGLYVIDRDGANLRRLQQEQVAVSFPAWSPDGARIAYVAGGAGGLATVRTYDFATANANTISEQAYVGQLGAPVAWSPDGKSLAFVEAASAAGRLRVYDVANRALANIADVPASAVAWAPKSSRITVVRPGDNQSSDIVSVKEDGSDLQVLQKGALLGDPRWSPDGKQLAFWTAPSAQVAQRALRLAQGGSGGPKDLGGGLDPAWSPDGKRIAYSRPDAATPGAQFDVYTVAAKGGQPELVTPATTLDRWPSWSPFGNAVVVLAQADQNTAFLCVVTLDTKKSTCLDTTGLLPAQPAWSPY